MSEHIAERLTSLETFFAEKPERAVAADSPATAVLGADLRCEVTGPNGWSVSTGMMRGVGGDASGPTPGWLMRSAIASCTATTIAMRAAMANIELESVSVTADSTSDGRGLLGLDGYHPEPLEMRLTVTISAPGVAPDDIERLVRESDLGSPIGETVRRQVSVTTEIVHADAVSPSGG